MRGSNGNIGLVPKEVADNLRGIEFNSLDNIIISSPRMHQEILDKGFHFNK